MIKLILALSIFMYSSHIYAKDLVIITADWCKACDQLKDFLTTNNSISSEYNIEYIDYDSNKDIVKKLRVKKLPTSIIFDDNGKIKSKNIGYDSIKYKKWLEEN